MDKIIAENPALALILSVVLGAVLSSLFGDSFRTSVKNRWGLFSKENARGRVDNLTNEVQRIEKYVNDPQLHTRDLILAILVMLRFFLLGIVILSITLVLPIRDILYFARIYNYDAIGLIIYVLFLLVILWAFILGYAQISNALRDSAKVRNFAAYKTAVEKTILELRAKYTL